MIRMNKLILLFCGTKEVLCIANLHFAKQIFVNLFNKTRTWRPLRGRGRRRYGNVMELNVTYETIRSYKYWRIWKWWIVGSWMDDIGFDWFDSNRIQIDWFGMNVEWIGIDIHLDCDMILRWIGLGTGMNYVCNRNRFECEWSLDWLLDGIMYWMLHCIE